jgi:hypothetical protein
MSTPGTTSTASVKNSSAVSQKTTRIHDRNYLAPSWSWASSKYAVDFVALNHLPSFPAPQTPYASKRGPIIIRQMSKQNRLVVNDAQVQLLGQNPFGEVSSGVLRVWGKVFDGTVVEVPPSRWKSGLGIVVIPSAKWHKHRKLVVQQQKTLQFVPDNPPLWRAPRTECAGRGSGSQKVQCAFVECWDSVRGWIALVIQPLDITDFVPRDETGNAYKAYQRIGVVGSWGDDNFNVFMESDWLYECPREYIELY